MHPDSTPLPRPLRTDDDAAPAPTRRSAAVEPAPTVRELAAVAAIIDRLADVAIAHMRGHLTYHEHATLRDLYRSLWPNTSLAAAGGSAAVPLREPQPGREHGAGRAQPATAPPPRPITEER